MVAASHPPRLRRRRSGPEGELVEGALAAQMLEQGAVVLREPELATGYPDIVAAFPSRRALQTPRRELFSPDHLRLVHFLVHAGATSVDNASLALRRPRTAIASMLADLHLAGVTSHRHGRVSVSVTRAFVATRIIAIEAKVDKWREALLQAAANAWFASHSFVLLPSASLSDRAAHEAQALGVGILVYDGRRVRTSVRPRVRAIPASLGSWIVHEWMLGLLSRG